MVRAPSPVSPPFDFMPRQALRKRRTAKEDLKCKGPEVEWTKNGEGTATLMTAFVVVLSFVCFSTP
jgi:hypothetical protein